MSNVKEVIQNDKDFLFHHISQHQAYQDGADPIVWVKGVGCEVTDIKGNTFLDAVSGGVWCVNVGYGRESIAKAVYDQLKEMCYYSMSNGNLTAIELAKQLVEVMPGAKRRVYFSNSGSEANEKAFKMARQYGRQKFGTNKYKIIFRHRDYHGTTIGALSATGQEERRKDYGPFLEGFIEAPACNCYRCPFDKQYPSCKIECATVLEEIILREKPDEVAAFIVEPITAGGGVLYPVDEYFPIVQEICKKYNVLLIMDEVVCGWGRTGKWFGYQHFDVQPDIVTMAKGMASAYQAISATVVKEEIFEGFLSKTPGGKYEYFRDISTYGGCAGSTAAALENMKIIKNENLVEEVKRKGEYLQKQLEAKLAAFPVVGRITCKGLFAGIEFVEDKASRKPADESKVIAVCGVANKMGVLLGRMNRSIPGLNSVLTLAPAYIVTEAQLDRIVDSIVAGIKEVFAC